VFQIVLCGGAIDSPKLLLLSGIGDSEDLKKVGVTPVLQRPGVGHNLQDHPAVGTYHTCRTQTQHMQQPTASPEASH
jgi:choline dehydrogenase